MDSVRHASIIALMVASAVVLAGSQSASAVDIETVPVGNTGNAGELSGSGSGSGGWGPDRICGAVAYTYNIGKYEVTAGQYCEFLNAVANTDTYSLYNLEMWSNRRGCKIDRSGDSGSYTYSVAADRANRPVNYVSWADAARFANWLHNSQGSGDTETGAYTLPAAGSSINVTRNTDWKWAITSEDEWYKAAYHKNDGDTGNYWGYPTSSNTEPSNNLVEPTDPGNNATFYDGTGTISSPYWRTEVGAHENSGSPYGTFDQGGNVWEWNEAVIYNSYRGLRGGAYSSSYGNGLASSVRDDYSPNLENDYIGFRVSEVPEPTTLSLLGIGGLVLIHRSRKSQRNRSA